MKNPYEVLGVSKDATEEEIKTAYRKLAHKCHPDKTGGSCENFKEVNAAYQILGDREKRKKFDQYGPAFEQMGGFGAGGSGQGGFGGAQGFGQGQQFDFGNLNDIFGDIFGFGGGEHGSVRQKRGRHIEMDIRVDFKEAVFGTEKELKVYRDMECPDCGGSGAAKGTGTVTCRECGGKGQVRSVRQSVFGAFQTVSTCRACEGRGQRPETPCRKCHGTGIFRGERVLGLKVPAGINDGEILRMSGEGEAAGKGGISGDLYVTVRVKPHPRFRRDGFDVLTTERIPMTLAALGGSLEVETLDGSVDLKIPPGTQSGQGFRLRGKGVPHLRRTGRGDHLVGVEVEIPKRLSRGQRKVLEGWNDL
ncbi:molecular chaperone DnaJ [Candidatus Uhrbacteria bacterium]|nr:molecular chaperone DnaJ [Candidatus Uhrbacteria bacterium]